MLVTDQRTEVHARCLPFAHAQLFGAFLQALDEGFENRPFDVDPLGTQAYLAAIGEGRTQSAFDRLVQVASANTTAAFLPPSSSDTGTMDSAAAS